jgi:hypothetical protein
LFAVVYLVIHQVILYIQRFGVAQQPHFGGGDYGVQRALREPVRVAHGDVSALSRRWRGVSRDKATYDGQQQALHPHQEKELVQYVCELHKQGLALTRDMIQNFGSEIAGRAVSISWVDRFLHRNHDDLIV